MSYIDLAYHIIGMIFVWLSVAIMLFMVLGHILDKSLNYLGKRFNTLFVIVEFQFYKKRFKEWVKDNPRHIKLRKKEDEK